MPRTPFLITLLFSSLLAFATPKMNVVFITLDDLSYESLGVNGCKVPDISPNMDKLAKAGMRFENAHVHASNCIPSRALMMTGMYQQHNHIFSLGKEGAGNQINKNTIPTIFRQAGYHTGIMGKNSHHSPFDPYTGFDVEYDTYGSTKYPDKVYEKTKLAIADSLKLDKPLFFNLNVYDPHVGFYGWDHKKHRAKKETTNHPSRIYTPDEIPYPSWFPPLSESARKYTNKSKQEVHIMDEVTAYYNTVKRADDSIGQLLRAFEEAQLMDKTIFVLISDHGGELTGGKTTLFHHGTHTPLFVTWPGVTEPGSKNTEHMIGSIDLLPTFCEMANQPIPDDLDGRSFLPQIKQQAVSQWRSFVYKQQNDRNKSRAIQDHDYLYIINAWHDGKTKFGSVTMGNLAWKVFEQAMVHPETNKLTVAWSQNIQLRCPEELYDIKNDPECHHNLIDKPDYQSAKNKMRQLMIKEAKVSGDDIFMDAMLDPQNPEARKATIAKIIAEAERKKNHPDFARYTFFDPLKDVTLIGNTLFEPKGEWGIWQAANDSVKLNTNNGHPLLGDNCVEFNFSDKLDSRLETKETFDGSSFKNINFDFAITQGAAPAKGKKNKKRKAKKSTNQLNPQAELQFLYHDGTKWKNLGASLISKLKPLNNFSFKAPNGGFPQSMRLAIAVDFVNSPGQVFLDGIRLSANQDWYELLSISKAKLEKESLKLEPKTAQNLGKIQVSYQFSGSNLAPQSKLHLENFDGTRWNSLKTQRYNYPLVAGSEYKSEFTFEHKTNRELQLRLRQEGPGSLQISKLQLKARSAY